MPSLTSTPGTRAEYLEARSDDSPAFFCSHHRNHGRGGYGRVMRPGNRLSALGLWSIVKGHGGRAGSSWRRTSVAIDSRRTFSQVGRAGPR